MLNDIKKINGIYNDEFDSIIESYIQSAKKDLESVGISKSKIMELDALIKPAIISYVQSFIDIDNSELHLNSYALQKDAIRHMEEYQDAIH